MLSCEGEGCVPGLWGLSLSTNAQPQQQDTVQCHEYDGRRVDVPCTTAMALYNAYMGGVDRNDQLRQYYHVRLKCQKCAGTLFGSSLR